MPGARYKLEMHKKLRGSARVSENGKEPEKRLAMGDVKSGFITGKGNPWSAAHHGVEKRK